MKFDRFSEIFQRRQRLWVAALGLALALGVAGAGASAYAQTSAASITTQVHLADHTPAPCAAQDCLGQVAPNKSVVHDLATVTSADPRMTPTGSVAFAFYTGTA
ncbi:MAG: hypothetical protein FJ316_10850, partial [SAR202 cluster bacterium]|nr:hypothetical protein [SAR202 cluster bacterium]